MTNGARNQGISRVRKGWITAVLTILLSVFMYQGWLKPLIIDSATNTYYFALDGTTRNIGADGTTNTTSVLNGKISMNLGTTYNTSRYVTAAANTNWQVMETVYGPAYAASQTLTSPVVTIGTRDYNGTSNLIYWKADIYDYDPAGAAGNGTLLWSSSGTDEAHQNVAAPKTLSFPDTAARNIEINHRLKVVVSCRMTSTNSAARFYWGSSTNYSYLTVTEAATAANTVTVTNLADYNNGALASVLQGQQNVAMLKFDLYANATTNWTGGLLDKIGNNPNLGDVTFSIYKDANGNGQFDPTVDSLIGGPYTFNQATGSPYTLATAQALTATPQRYFIVYNISGTAALATTVGARVSGNSYFTVSDGLTVAGVNGTSSSLPSITGTGAAVTKTYAADWDTGTALVRPEAGGPTATNSLCVTSTITEPAGTNLVALLNYPGHSCTSVSGRYHTSSEANSKFVTLYFNGPGYTTLMSQIKGVSFRSRLRSTGNGTFTVTLFYVKPDGTKVNSPVSSTFTTSNATTYTMSLAGQTFTNVPTGSRLGVQIGVSSSGCGIGLGGAVGAQLVVEETSGVSTGVFVGDGTAIPSSSVLASSTGNVVNSFTLTSPSSNQTVTSISVTGNASTTSTNVAAVRLYADTGTIGTLDPSDTLLGTGTFSGTTAVISGLSELVGPTYKNYLIVYDITGTPTVGARLTGLVTDAGGVTVDSNGDANSAILTVLSTTTIGNGSSEPPTLVVPSGGAATNVDAFSLSTNGGPNDTINTVTVSLAPAGISTKVSTVEIVDRVSGTVYGQLTAPTSGEDWRVSTSGLVATSSATEYYVRVTPKNNVTATYNVTGLVTAATHLQTTSGIVVSDTSSGTVIFDGEAPTNPVLTATTGANAGEIQLSWTATTDYSGLSSSRAYTVVRGDANAPAPADCSSGIQVYQGTALSKTDTSLLGGQAYSYRVCAADVVNNTSSGTTASAIARQSTVCNIAPTVTVFPTNQYAKAGGQASYSIYVTNNDTGSCANTTFTISILGTENSTDFITPSTIAPASLILGPNGGGSTATLTVTSKPAAPQGATDVFSVRVSAAGHPSTDSVPITTNVNNYGKMLHSSMLLGTRYGAWGTDYTCYTCHVKGATNNIMDVREIITTPSGNRPVVFSKMSAAATVTSGVLGNDLRGGTTSQNICEVCHHQTRFHQYSASKVAWQDHNNSATCVKCHSHGNGFKYSGGAQCDDCHGNPPKSLSQMTAPATNALGGAAPNAGAHAAHEPLTTCYACHSNYTSSPMGNQLIEMGFRINNTTYPGFAGNLSGGVFTGTNTLNTFYRWTTASGTVLQKVANTTSCSVYCHGWSGSNGNNSTPNWVGVNQTMCGACHGASGSNPPTSGSHTKHASTGIGNNGIACVKCHSTYTNYSSAAHINGNVQWNLSLVSASAAYRGLNSGGTGAPAPTATGNYGTCSTVYCHSNVQGTNGVGTPTYYASPKWGDQSTASCGSCHVNMYNDANATGGHVQHAQNPDTNFDCRICHGTGGDANPQNHANGTIDMAFQGYGANTVYSKGSHAPGTAYGTCSTSNCHGRRTIAWGAATATPLCEKCHGSASTSGFYGTAGPGSTMATTDPQVGAHAQHIKSAPYQYTGKQDCSECHLKAAGPYSPGHIDSPLPAEVTFGAMAKAGTQFGYTSVPTYSYASRKCSNTWCHGAGMDSNRGTGAYANVIADGGTLGSPLVPTWNVTMLTGTASNDCTRCHSYPPPAPNSSYTHFGKVPTDCNGCHNNVNTNGTGFVSYSSSLLHINGKIDGGCISCHANPPVDTAGLVNPPLNAMSTGHEGAHNAHFLNSNIGNNCATCHNNYTRQMPSHTLEIGFNGYGGKVTSGTFYGYSTLTNNDVYASSSAGTIVRRTNNTALQNTCSNVYCHGGGTSTLPPIGGGSNTKPDWELGTPEVTCGSCHGTSTTSAPTAGSHSKHALSTGLGLTCDLCHGLKTNNYHANGNVEWHLNVSDPRIGAGATYRNLSSGGTGSLAPSITFGSCNNLYCHSNAQAAGGLGAPSSYTNQTWGATGPLACSSCHKDMATDGTGTGSHYKHANVRGYSCATCHNSAGSGTALHVNRTIDLAFSGPAAGTTYSTGSHTAGSAAYGTCSASYCHSNGQSSPTYANPTWGGTLASDCSSCHGTATSNTLSGRHSQHLNPAVNTSLGLGNGFGCVDCHSKTVSNNTTINIQTNHINQFIDYSGLRAGGSARYSTATKRCTNIYCHSNGNPGAFVYINMTGSKTWTGSASFGCNGCHGRSNAATGYPDYANGGAGSNTANSHSKHMTQFVAQGAANATTTCARCHSRTVSTAAAGNLRNYSTLHLNGTPSVSMPAAYGGSYSANVCSNVSCHSNGKGAYRNATWGATSDCAFCHPMNGLSRGHIFHVFTSATNTPAFYSFTANRSGIVSGSQRYNFGCSTCHPITNASHTTGQVLIDLRPGVAGAGSIRNKNSSGITAGAVPAGTANSGTIIPQAGQVKCINIYCHSNGMAGASFRAYTSPDWYAGNFTGDRCAGCHGNSPNSGGKAGSAAHQVHTASPVHGGDIFSGRDGKMAPAGTTGTVAAHGDPAQATTINCNTCHNATVTSSANDSGSACVGCHGAVKQYGAVAHGNASIASKSAHVNGRVDVAFAAVTVTSKAQVRTASFTNTTTISNNWTRNGSYKTGTTAFDRAKNALAPASWNGGTCSSIACHNGKPANWLNDAGKAAACVMCHSNL